jgi:mannitol/fructose-specific phosphotransferase system IIA component (Ntr-type)
VEDVSLKTDPILHSLKRRFAAMKEDKKIDIIFKPIASRDSAKTVHLASNAYRSEFVVMAWGGRVRLGRWFRNPHIWIADHIRCNFAMFKDAGVRYIRKILVFAEPGPHDVLVVSTADYLARQFNAKITFIQFISDKESEPFFQSRIHYINELRHLCKSSCSTRVLRGENLYKSITDETAYHDLLVLGAPPEKGFKRIFANSKEDKITEMAACSVLRLRTPRTKTHSELVTKAQDSEQKSRSLLKWLDKNLVDPNVNIKKKEELFSHIAKTLATALKNVSAAEIEKALWERENTQNTAVGRGLALPHATIEIATETILAVFTTQNPIDYKSASEEKVNVFMVTLGPSSHRHTHLILLARIARIVLETNIVTELKQAKTKKEAILIIEKNVAGL